MNVFFRSSALMIAFALCGLVLAIGCQPQEQASAPAAVEEAPFELTGNAEEGRELYTVQCASCHGAEGAGDGPAGQALNPQPKDLSASTLSPGQVYQVIAEGGPSVELSPLMPGFANSFDETQLQNVTAFVVGLR